jgi:hypothetical protein
METELHTRARDVLELERVEARIRELRAALRHAGQVLAGLGASLASAPENTTFANAPAPLGHMPMNLVNGRPYDWNSIPDKTVIAQKVQELRQMFELRSALYQHLQGRAIR